MLDVERRREDFSGGTKKRRRGVVSRGEWEQPRGWGRRGVSELDRGTDDGEILRRIRRGRRREEENIRVVLDGRRWEHS